jgi:hypothetical protein
MEVRREVQTARLTGAWQRAGSRLLCWMLKSAADLVNFLQLLVS